MNVSSDWRIWFIVVINDIAWMRFYVVPLLIFTGPVVVRWATSLPKELAKQIGGGNFRKFRSIFIFRRHLHSLFKAHFCVVKGVLHCQYIGPRTKLDPRAFASTQGFGNSLVLIVASVTEGYRWRQGLPRGSVCFDRGYDMRMSTTGTAFNKLRSVLGEARLPPPELIANEDQVKQMTVSDGLIQWLDGKGHVGSPGQPPLLDQRNTKNAHLWVVRTDDVVHVPEQCDFGARLASGVVKHTNLTGGTAAFCGGELLFLEDGTIVVNGCSGRYGPRNRAELDQIVIAFVESGYGVWSMGFDEETNRPAGFVGVLPEWVI